MKRPKKTGKGEIRYVTSEERCADEKDRQMPEAFWYQIEFLI